MQTKKVLALLIAAILLTATFSYIAWGPSVSFTTYIEDGSQVTESSYILFQDGSTYYSRDGETGEVTSSTNASYLINTALTDANGEGRVFLRHGIYELDTSITITINGSKLEGSGSGREQHYFGTIPSPLERLTIGTVLRIMTSGIDAIQIQGKVFGVSLKHFAIDFNVASTGCGINASVTNNVGLSEFHFEDIFINDHDIDSYAIRLENGVLGRIDGITSFGGPLLELVSETTVWGTFNSGNSIYNQVSGWITKNITNHAVYIHRNGGSGWSNLYIFNRLFVIMDAPTPALNVSNYSALRCEYMHHSQFNMLNIEFTYVVTADCVHLAACADLDFISPYVMYSANAGWMAYLDCSHLRVFGGTVDIAVADRDRTDLWVGTFISSVGANNEASLRDCLIWNGTALEPTNAYGSSSGTSPLTIAHGMAYSPTWINVTPNATAGDWYVGVVDGGDTFDITWTGGGTVWWWWSAGTHQVRP